jgi:hypothetical protein
LINRPQGSLDLWVEMGRLLMGRERRVKTPYMLVMGGDHIYDPSDIKRMLPHIYFKR